MLTHPDIESRRGERAGGLVDNEDLIDHDTRLAELAYDTKRRLKRTVEDLYHIGLNLTEAKQMLKHGEFINWIDTELGIDPKSAERFINVTRMLQNKFDIMSNLDNEVLPAPAMLCDGLSRIAPTVLYEIAAPSTPDEARNEIINLALDGEKVTVLDAKRIIKAYKSAHLEQKVAEPVSKATVLQNSPVSTNPAPWLTISQNHPHLAGQKCRVKYESSPGQLMCELEDGTIVLISNEFLNEEIEFKSVPQKQTFTLEEIQLLKEQHKLEIDRLNKDWEVKNQSLRSKAPIDLEIEYQELQAAYAKLLAENTRLKQEVQSLQSLRSLEEENKHLRQENQRLEHAVSDIPDQKWNHGVLNEEATKALNKHVASMIEKFPPELHLRSLAEKPPELEIMPEAMKLIGQTLQNLVPIGVKKYRDALESANNWLEIEPITVEWISLKPNIWTQLTATERIKIKQLIEASGALKIGDRVQRVGGDPYDAEYGLCGEIVAFVSNDFRVRWTRRDGSSFEKRQSPDEINLIIEVA